MAAKLKGDGLVASATFWRIKSIAETVDLSAAGTAEPSEVGRMARR